MLTGSGKELLRLATFIVIACTLGAGRSSFSEPSSRCARLAEIQTLKLDPFSNGILTRTADGKLVFTYGCAMISHKELLTHAEQSYGAAESILWAGELKAESNSISVINETAGIMIRDTPSIRSKVSDLGNLVELYERHPRLRRFFSAEPKLIRYSENLPPEELHLFQGLRDIARFRHDIQGAAATFLALSDLLEHDPDADHLFREMSGMVKIRAKDLRDLLGIANEHGLGNRNPLDPKGTKLQQALESIMNEGLDAEPAVNRERISTIRTEMKYFLAKEMKMFSVLIESP